MTPEQALVLIENLKREAPEKLIAAGNTIALHAARWAQQAIIRDRKIYAEVQAIKSLLLQAAGVAGGEPSETADAAAAPAANGVHMNGADPSTLKGAELEAYMDAMLKNEAPNPNAPGPVESFGAAASAEPASSEVVGEEPAARPEGVVVVPAAAAKAKTRAAQASGNVAPKA